MRQILLQPIFIAVQVRTKGTSFETINLLRFEKQRMKRKTLICHGYALLKRTKTDLNEKEIHHVTIKFIATMIFVVFFKQRSSVYTCIGICACCTSTANVTKEWNLFYKLCKPHYVMLSSSPQKTHR